MKEIKVKIRELVERDVTYRISVPDNFPSEYPGNYPTAILELWDYLEEQQLNPQFGNENIHSEKLIHWETF